eukprot:4918533-Pleurochrysis_carterae.AAC.2
MHVHAGRSSVMRGGSVCQGGGEQAAGVAACGARGAQGSATAEPNRGRVATDAGAAGGGGGLGGGGRCQGGGSGGGKAVGKRAEADGFGGGGSG